MVELVPLWEETSESSLFPPFISSLTAMMLPDSGCLLLKKPRLERQVLVWMERLLYSGGWQPEEKMDLCPKTNSKDSARSWTFLKGESFGNGAQNLPYLPLRAAFLLTGWWWGNQNRWCSRNLVFKLKSASSTWVGALLPAEELKGIVIHLYIPWGRIRTLPQSSTIIW